MDSGLCIDGTVYDIAVGKKGKSIYIGGDFTLCNNDYTNFIVSQTTKRRKERDCELTDKGNQFHWGCGRRRNEWNSETNFCSS